MRAWFDQAVALHGQGHLDEAARLYEQVLAANPNFMDARHMLGVVRAQQGRNTEAHDLIAPVAAANPNDPLALANFGNVLGALERREEAVAHYDRSLALNPGYASAWFFRGNMLQILLRYGEALQSYDRFLALIPAGAEGWNNRGTSLQSLGRIEEAQESIRRALNLDPAMAEAQLNLGFYHLLTQDFAHGLPLLEWRKRMPEPMESRVYSQPIWDGKQDINGKTLFVYIEQGLGDAIQYYRYIGLAQARGAKVILSVPNQLIALFGSAVPQAQLIGWGQVPPAFDFHIPLASIALAVGMRIETIPVADRYLSAEPQRVARWKDKLGEHGFRIGIAWQGNQLVLGSEGKAFAISALESISRLPGVRLIGLQKNTGSEQLANLPAGMTVERYDFDEGPDAFLDTAAIMKNCDLVITADTAPAHLAGALGVPAWVALKYVPDWRWFLGRGDSPWYPSLRLFRQAAPNDWASVFAAMQAELRGAVHQR